MKNLLLISLLLFSFNPNSFSQFCPELPDTVFQCGFTVDLELEEITSIGEWIYDCDQGPGNIAISSNFPFHNFSFSECGTYKVYFELDGCELDSIIFEIDDPSFTAYNLSTYNNFGYGQVVCLTGDIACDNEVVINGGETPDPEWDMCQILTCSYQHFIATSEPENPEFCMAEIIIVESELGSDAGESCWNGDQSAFVVIDEATGEIISNDFFEFMEDLYNQSQGQTSCPTAPEGCFEPDESCIDSITLDTNYLLFPIHLGGRWTMIDNNDTIVLSDTTAISLISKDFLFIIEPGADYYGPGPLTFTLLELDGTDTVPAYYDLEFVLWWEELYVYDTLVVVDIIYHNSEDPECIPCGGNSFASSFDIPEIPIFPCGPILIGFGEPCSCEDGELVVTANAFINCFDPCAILEATFSSSDPNVTISEYSWFQNGSLIGSGPTNVICYEGGPYELIATSALGCEYSTNIYVEEDFYIPEYEAQGPYTLDCYNECVSISSGFIDNWGDLNYIFTLPDGTIISDVEEVLVCEAGTVSIQATSLWNGCSDIYEIEINEDFTNFPLDINPPEPITCDNPCVDIIPDLSNFPSSINVYWTGPNGFTSNEIDISVCQEGEYELNVYYGQCFSINSVTVVELFQPSEINIGIEICDGDCYYFNGQSFCEEGDFIVEEACDSTYNLHITKIYPENLFQQEVLCDGESILIHEVEYDEEGVYYYSYEDPNGNGCPVYVELVITTFSSGFQIEGDDDITCENQTITLIASSSNSNNNYTWFNDQNEIVGTGPTFETDKEGTYICVNSNQNGDCSSTEMITINNFSDIPDLDVEPNYTLNCEDGIQLSVTTDPDDNLTFTWVGPGITEDNKHDESPVVSSPGEYTVYVNNEYGCVNEGVATVAVIEDLNLEAVTINSCSNNPSGQLEINIENGGIGPFQYNINGGAWQDSPVFENLDSDEYTYGILHSDGCEESGIISVELIPEINPFIDHEEVYDLCETAFIEVDLSSELSDNPMWELEWNDGGSEAKRTLSEDGQYSLEISNECEVREYRFDISDTRIDEEKLIYYPNIFSPNDDGINDQFICYPGQEIVSFEITIYDRWGSEVFTSADITKSWKGFIQGDLGKQDVYPYVSEYEIRGCKGKMEKFKMIGDVTIIR